MDIIPIIPAPQQGTSTPSLEIPARSSEAGFDTILNQEIPTNDNSVGLSRISKAQNQQNTSGSSPLEEHSMASHSKAAPDNRSIQVLDFHTGQNSTGSLHDDDQQEIVTGNQTHPLRSDLDSLVQHHSHRNKWASDVDAYETSIAPGSLRIISDRAKGDWSDIHLDENSLELFNTRNDITQIRGLPDLLRPLECNEISEYNNTADHGLPLQLRSTASAFSVKSSEAVATINITAQKSFIDVDIQIPPTQYHGTPENSTPSLMLDSQQAGVQSPFKTEPISPNFFVSEMVEAFFDTPQISIFTKNQPGNVPAGLQQSLGKSSILLQELQKLIAQSNDTISIDISSEAKVHPSKGLGDLLSPLIQEHPEAIRIVTESAAGANNNVPLETMLDGSEAVAQTKTDTLRTPVNEKTNEQVLNTKSELFDKYVEQNSNNQTSQQNLNSSNNNSLQQQATTAATNNNSISTDQSSVEHTFASQFHDVGSPQTAETAKIGTTPSTHLNFVRDQEVINQLVERFTAHTRLQTSRLSLQLHPAELGELKIDVIVKGDVLKANIYAQTPQAGELIDRNLPRLKEILQDQGISVDDLVVSFKSDSIDDYSSQHGQLFQDQAQLLKQPQKTVTTSNFEIEETLVANKNDQSGVNLTI